MSIVDQNTKKVNSGVGFTPKDLLLHCWRGGTFAAIWIPDRKTFWMPIAEWAEGKIKAPAIFTRGDIYFGVNPSLQIPPRNKRGNTNPLYIGPQDEYLECINVLYAEYDGKDEVPAAEYRKHLPSDFTTTTQQQQKEAAKAAREAVFYGDPEPYRRLAWRRLINRSSAVGLPPTVIVDSGGGYHAYFFLRDTVYIDDGNRDDLTKTQHDFVAMMEADTGAADMRRVLRLPGSKNHKAGFGDNKPTARIVHYSDGALYDYATIEQVVGDWAFENRRNQQCELQTNGDNRVTVNDGKMGAVRAAFNKKFRIATMLAHKGYGLVATDQTTGFIRMSRPTKGKVESVSIFPATETLPEISYHHSGNDELHCDKVRRVDGDGVIHKGLDAFAVYAHLWHGGKFKRAYIAAKKQLGMWVDDVVDGNVDELAEGGAK